MKLKNCPFCGGPASIENTVTEMTVRCDNIYCRAGILVKKMIVRCSDKHWNRKLARRWNRRFGKG